MACWACSCKTLLCFAIRLPIVITSAPCVTYCYANNIIVSNLQKMTSAHIGRPLCHCWRHIGTAVTAAMAAALSPPLPPSPLLLPLPRLPPSLQPPAHCYRFLVDCCLPSCCLCLGHRCLPLPLPPLAVDAIATVAAAANRCPLLLPSQLHDVQNITFKVIF